MLPLNPIETMDVYASTSQYIEGPTKEQQARGTVPLDTLPADWWNWLWKQITERINQASAGMESIYDEVMSVLTAASIEPSQLQSDQLLNAIKALARVTGTAAVAGAVKSSSDSGKVAIDADGIMTVNGLGVPASLNTSSKNVVNAINEILTTLGNYKTETDSALDGKLGVSAQAADSAKLGGTTKEDLFTDFSVTDNGISATIGGTTKVVDLATTSAVHACCAKCNGSGQPFGNLATGNIYSDKIYEGAEQYWGDRENAPEVRFLMYSAIGSSTRCFPAAYVCDGELYMWVSPWTCRNPLPTYYQVRGACVTANSEYRSHGAWIRNETDGCSSISSEPNACGGYPIMCGYKYNYGVLGMPGYTKFRNISLRVPILNSVSGSIPDDLTVRYSMCLYGDGGGGSNADRCICGYFMVCSTDMNGQDERVDICQEFRHWNSCCRVSCAICVDIPMNRYVTCAVAYVTCSCIESAQSNAAFLTVRGPSTAILL